MEGYSVSNFHSDPARPSKFSDATPPRLTNDAKYQRLLAVLNQPGTKGVLKDDVTSEGLSTPFSRTRKKPHMINIKTF